MSIINWLGKRLLEERKLIVKLGENDSSFYNGTFSIGQDGRKSPIFRICITHSLFKLVFDLVKIVDENLS